ncbi:MAG: hypothetical protein JRJ29_09855 [Deltaproteobacteria bacterium]|nr:hypothetical protein [Deltaproteobacteria bacterium]
MQGSVSVACEAFRKNPDGSWTSVQTTIIRAPIGEIRISPGMTFRKGAKLVGVDVAALLEQDCL